MDRIELSEEQRASIAKTAVGRYLKSHGRAKVFCMREHKMSLIIKKAPT